jgi:tetratricopeptide (TPR) repeat protein
MVETLELPRLATDDVRAIVRAVAGGPLPSELEPVVVAKAAGSPFFAEELVRTLVEEGHLQGNGSGLRLARPLAEIPMPGTIHEVIAARLDRLSPHTKRVVQVAAVLGRQFSRRDVAALLAEERIAVARELDTLVERGLLHRKTTLGEDELRFGESLVQEVAYEGLLLRQRRQLHERVARLLEALPGAGGPERSALLAHHWARSDDRRRAVEALLRAARDAEAVPSYAVAAEFYRRAWEATEAALAEAPDERLERAALEATAALSRLVVYFALPLVDDALRAVARTRELAERLREPEALAGSFYMQGVLTTMLDGRRYAEGLALAERGLAIAEEQGLRLATARIARGMCINYTVDGRFEQARRLIDPLLAAMEQVENAAAPSDLYLSTRWAKDVLLYACDDLDAALTHLTDTLALGERAGNRTIRCIASGLLAQIHYLRGDDERSKACADRCLEIAETIGNMSAYPAAASLAILTRSALGETVDAALHVERLEQGLAAAGVMQLNVRFVAEALLAAGDVGRAQAHVETLHAVVGGRLRQALVELAWADVMAALGRAAEAARGYRAAVALSEEIGARSPLAAALIGLADLDVQRGAAPDARLVARARGICDTVGLGRYRARLERLTAQPAPALAAPA